MVSLWRKYDHKMPALKELHWLLLEQRIHFKILLLVSKTQHCIAPPYLSPLLSHYKSTGRPLRSEGKYLLTTHQNRLEGFSKSLFRPYRPSPLEHALWRQTCLTLYWLHCCQNPSFSWLQKNWLTSSIGHIPSSQSSSLGHIISGQACPLLTDIEKNPAKWRKLFGFEPNYQNISHRHIWL